MNITIENIAGGSRCTFRKLSTMARYIAQNPVFGGYNIVCGETDESLAIVRYAEAARREVGRNDWDAVVNQAITWFDSESADEAMQ
jgi:hypothetical protein